MDLGSFLLIFALFLFVGLIVSRPLTEPKVDFIRSDSNGSDHERSSLLAERDRIINAVKELDFDHALGKIPEEDYPIQRSELLKKGAFVLHELDKLEPSLEGYEVEDRLEAAISAHRARGSRASLAVEGDAEIGTNLSRNSVSAPDDELELVIANRRRSRKGKAVGFCHNCGKPLQKNDEFCPRCGQKVN